MATKKKETLCACPHPVSELGWTCSLPEGHEGPHQANPPTVTGTEVAAMLARSETTTLKDLFTEFNRWGHMLPSSENR
jgi:hypothetical protein